ncbi:DUF2155 domain-containing protein [Saccharibacter sp. 17.LH.SD]|uniref:DUF2155 domain-containing protein n=1 Tax=Saccharibacter sp. 17.LH.SD TaxID=2689393 RepID=UPI00136C5B33|nr:DUF2155 domain-containing protein [Saccharibacter sp. 17.LH.SD]MXV45102.1 DUF2155 domain-containing protein [Saccharibacter sp. 17.LH.SD]
MNSVSYGKKLGVLGVVGLGLLFSTVCTSQAGVRGIAPPAVYAANTWQGRSEVVLRVMNRLDSHVDYFTVPVGQTETFRSLTIQASACLQRPPTLPADSAAQLHIEETQVKETPPFDGWMLVSSPSLGVYASALYDVQIVGCQGHNVAPDPGPLPQPQVPVISTASSPHVDADNVHDAPVASQNSGNGPMSLLPEQPSQPPAPNKEMPPPSAPDTSGAIPLVPPS